MSERAEVVITVRSTASWLLRGWPAWQLVSCALHRPLFPDGRRGAFSFRSEAAQNSFKAKEESCRQKRFQKRGKEIDRENGEDCSRFHNSQSNPPPKPQKGNAASQKLCLYIYIYVLFCFLWLSSDRTLNALQLGQQLDIVGGKLRCLGNWREPVTVGCSRPPLRISRKSVLRIPPDRMEGPYAQRSFPVLLLRWFRSDTTTYPAECVRLERKKPKKKKGHVELLVG